MSEIEALTQNLKPRRAELWVDPETGEVWYSYWWPWRKEREQIAPEPIIWEIDYVPKAMRFLLVR